jgi:hypothetical protein
MRTAIILSRKHGSNQFELHPLSGLEGTLPKLKAEFKEALLCGRSHPKFAEVRYYDAHPARVHKFKTPEAAQADEDLKAEHNAIFEAEQKKQAKKTKQAKAEAEA